MSEKLTKKDLKEDEVLNFFVSLFHKLKDNKKLMRPVLVGLGIIIIGLPVLYKVIQNKKEKAEVLYIEGMSEYAAQNPNYEFVIDRLKKAKEAYSGGDINQLSLLNIGNSYLRLKKYDEAVKYYDEFIYNGQLPEFIPVAKLCKAQVYIEKNETDAAREMLDSILTSSPSHYVIPEVKYYRALLYDKKKNFAKAEALFKEIAEKHGDSSWGELARNTLIYYKHAADLGPLPYSIMEDTGLLTAKADAASSDQSDETGTLKK